MAYQFLYEHRLGCVAGRMTSRGVAELVLGISQPVCSVASPLTAELSTALERYFSGREEDFAHVPLDLDRGTPFQRRVWLAAREIGWGSTITYGQLAARVGCGSARAVGQALGANPAPILTPCHRIVAADGGLGGFSCGLEWKRALLRLEKVALRA